MSPVNSFLLSNRKLPCIKSGREQTHGWMRYCNRLHALIRTIQMIIFHMISLLQLSFGCMTKYLPKKYLVNTVSLSSRLTITLNAGPVCDLSHRYLMKDFFFRLIIDAELNLSAISSNLLLVMEQFISIVESPKIKMIKTKVLYGTMQLISSAQISNLGLYSSCPHTQLKEIKAERWGDKKQDQVIYILWKSQFGISLRTVSKWLQAILFSIYKLILLLSYECHLKYCHDGKC